MVKRILLFLLFDLALFLSAFFIHNSIVSSSLGYDLFGVYLFFAISALFVYSSVELAAVYIKEKAGYAFLMGIFIKMGLFLLVFKDSIFSIEELTMTDRLSIMLPFFLFLFLEAFAVAKLLVLNSASKG